LIQPGVTHGSVPSFEVPSTARGKSVTCTIS
jgi:hypothetical protein